VSGQIFDVIIAGAGPAGTTAALLLARQGYKVVLIERGEYPGAKNMFGGALHGRVLHEIIPEFWTKAPVERFVNRKTLSLLTDDSVVSLDVNLDAFKKPPYNGLVVRRTGFDRWYANEAVKAGALLLNQTTVDDVIREGNQIVGVKARRGEIRARVVLAADGALSLLARKAGLRGEFTPEQFALGVKEVIQLPPGVLEERFSLTGNEGMSNEFLGRLGDGLHGGAFLYTNRESLSIGVVARAHSLKAGKATIIKERGHTFSKGMSAEERGHTFSKGMSPIYDALDQFKRHPAIAPLVAGGRFLEYSAHLIPEAGVSRIPKLFTGGMLVAGDAAGLVLSGGVFLEGVNLAIASGRLAAETVLYAFDKGDFSEKTMAVYGAKLKESFVLQDMNRYKNAVPMLLNERLYEFYPSFICRTLERWFTVDGTGHPKLAGMVKGLLDEEIGLWQAAKDGYQMGRAMVW